MNSSTLEAISKGVKQLTGSQYLTGVLKFFTQLAFLVLLLFAIYYGIHICNRFVDQDRRLLYKKQQVLKVVLWTVGIFLLLLLFNFGGSLFRLLSPFITAVVFAYILNPWVRALEKKGIKRVWGILLIYLGVSIALLTISLTILPKITLEIKRLLVLLPSFSSKAYDYVNQLYQSLNQYLQNLPAEFNGVKNFQPISEDWIQKLVVNSIGGITTSLASIFSSIFNLILVPVLTFYFLKDTEQFKRTMVLLIPSKRRKETLALFNEFDEVLGGFVRGQLIVASFVGILTIIALLIIGVDFAVLLGIIAGIADVIPYFGPIIGIFPAVFFALIDTPMKAVWVIVACVIIQQVESNILSPKIVGEQVGVHPVWIILSLLIAGKYFGIVGLIFAVPTVGILRVLIKHFVNRVAKI